MRKAVILPLLFVLLVSTAEAAKQISVKKLRYSSYESYTRIVVDLNGRIEFTQNRISSPDRLFFDLKECILSGDAKPSIHIENGIIKTVRMAQFNKNTVRVVLDIDKLEKYSAFLLDEPNRLVIDVYTVVKKEERSDNESSRKALPDSSLNKIKTIVIDPGHGGKDPGAIGPGGLREKDITLYVGEKLGEIIKAKNGVDVIYTRDADVFVPLNDRTEIANSKKADLFISIHVNASEKRKARGIETYFLNWTNNKEALRVAARENKISISKMQEIQDGLQSILQDLARNNKREESMRLAHSVQNAMVTTLKNDYTKIEDLGVKYALFYVLVGAEMPSILVEISFISNHEEEKRLAVNDYRNKIAEAIAIGINTYISQSSLIVKDDRETIPAGEGMVTPIEKVQSVNERSSLTMYTDSKDGSFLSSGMKKD
ncbi:MAG: N-acetylmuramoyl-L-alanine amidase [Nitrospirae bacterium]|nr:N-acetylmuramoyl-L-alanine amidase [Nitrospirota bacterium]